MSTIVTRGNAGAALRAATDRKLPRVPLGEAGKRATAIPIPDDKIKTLLKLIPGEAAALYTVACNLVKGEAYLPLAAFVLSVIVVIWTVRMPASNQVPRVTPEPMQYAVGLAAFAAWAFLIGSPIQAWVTIPGWIPALGVLFIPIFGTFVLGGSKDADVHPA
jgi:hypothetical protein